MPPSNLSEPMGQRAFCLPDLGEGLSEALIQEWHVHPPCAVSKGQPLVTVETAKALVDIPVPEDGRLHAVCASSGESVFVGQPLVYWTPAEPGCEAPVSEEPVSLGIVGTVVSGSDQAGIFDAGLSCVKIPCSSPSQKASPRVRAAWKAGDVSYTDWPESGSGPEGMWTLQDAPPGPATPGNPHAPEHSTAEWTRMEPWRTAMARVVEKAYRVPQVTVHDQADLGAWQDKQTGLVTPRVIRALCYAVGEEPGLNAWLDAVGQQIRYFGSSVHVGVALDTPSGLWMPVLRSAHQYSEMQALRGALDRLKAQATSGVLPHENWQGASILLSNFGVFQGQYATPLVIPPAVAILGVGRLRWEEESGHNHLSHLPLSLSVDHRAVTGGEAARFLRALMNDLAKPV